MGALPYPILKAGGAIVVDSLKASQVAWNAVNENLDAANQLMKQRQDQVRSDYGTLSALAEKSAILDEQDINNSIIDNRNWYAEESSKRNVNSASFIKDFNERMAGTQNLYGKAVASNQAQADNEKRLAELSGFWKTDEMLQGILENRTVNLADRDNDILSTLMRDPKYYDLDGRMAAFANTYRDGMETKVGGFERNGDNWKFSRTFNPAIHTIKIDPITQKDYVEYGINPELFSQYMLDDEGFSQSMNGRAELIRTDLLNRVDDLASREANGEIIPEDEKLSEWEEKFLEAGGGDKNTEAQARMAFNQDLKGRVSSKYDEFYVGITEEKRQANALERARIAAESRPERVADVNRQEVAKEQDDFFASVSTGANRDKAMNDMIKERESGGGIVRGTFQTEDVGDGIIKATYHTRSRNEYNYKNILREKIMYFDSRNKGSVLNAFKQIGEKKDWRMQGTVGERKLPSVNQRGVIVGEERKEGVTDEQFKSEQGLGLSNQDSETSDSGVSSENEL